MRLFAIWLEGASQKLLAQVINRMQLAGRIFIKPQVPTVARAAIEQVPAGSVNSAFKFGEEQPAVCLEAGCNPLIF